MIKVSTTSTYKASIEIVKPAISEVDKEKLLRYFEKIGVIEKTREYIFKEVFLKHQPENLNMSIKIDVINSKLIMDIEITHDGKYIPNLENTLIKLCEKICNSLEKEISNFLKMYFLIQICSNSE